MEHCVDIRTYAGAYTCNLEKKLFPEGIFLKTLLNRDD